MKKISLLLCLLFIMCSLCGCGSQKESVSSVADEKSSTVIEEWQDEAVKLALEEMIKSTKDFKNHSNKNPKGEPYLEIKNTRLITIKPDATDKYNLINRVKVKYIVEFLSFSNYIQTAPYYFWSYDSFVITEEGKCYAYDIFSTYRQQHMFDEITQVIENIYDLGDAYNKVYDLSE